MKISIAWMATTLRELELLSPLLVSQSTLTTSARPLHWAAAWEVFHLITGLFLIIYASHIPCHFHCISHSIPTSVFFDFLFHFHHLLCSSTLKHPQSVQLYEIAVILNTSLTGSIVIYISSSLRGSPGSIPHSSQHIIQIFILLQPRQHPFLVLLWVHKPPFHHVRPSNVQPCYRF